MMAQLRSALRAVVLPAPETRLQDTPTRRLLGELGHDVARAETPDHAIELLSSDHTDLLVVDVTNENQNTQLIDSLASLPDDKRPVQVAIYTDAISTRLRDFRRNYAHSHVHIFLRPLHMHGLLGVLRHMERTDLEQRAGA
jgi:response regulator RpfG family c-di-GMP phosphodiesterase